MTDKQLNFLSKYLSKNNLKKLSSMDKNRQYNISKSFIDLILHMRWYHQVYGEMCAIPYFTEIPNSKDKKEIEQLINRNRKRFGLLEDEYASVIEKDFLDENHVWYLVKQEWFKGMSETASTKTVEVKFIPSEIEYCSTCVPFENIYNELFDMEIYSVNKLIDFYYDKAKDKCMERR